MKTVYLQILSLACLTLLGCQSTNEVNWNGQNAFGLKTIQVRSKLLIPKVRKGLRVYIATRIPDDSKEGDGRMTSMDAFLMYGREKIELYWSDAFENQEHILSKGNEYNFTVDIEGGEAWIGYQQTGFLTSISDLSGRKIWPLKEHKKLEQKD